ncbi:lipoprotein 17-related variable surface protein [Mycoplasma sp. Ms02]|uniref:lipoprotein 17-related variable surface protein n=1 Tax=Mycoplasma sp. Ms02 TaxID=353851 RepID=UPI001C8A10C0|nr:lipoprotein 17-related variable surface protein [Mycoplasma sp. Ms02]QZE12522.1 GA module-containing protein [Mycoplasma sp. Ms02]
MKKNKIILPLVSSAILGTTISAISLSNVRETTTGKNLVKLKGVAIEIDSQINQIANLEQDYTYKGDFFRSIEGRRRQVKNDDALEKEFATRTVQVHPINYDFNNATSKETFTPLDPRGLMNKDRQDWLVIINDRVINGLVGHDPAFIDVSIFLSDDLTFDKLNDNASIQYEVISRTKGELTGTHENDSGDLFLDTRQRWFRREERSAFAGQSEKWSDYISPFYRKYTNNERSFGEEDVVNSDFRYGNTSILVPWSNRYDNLIRTIRYQPQSIEQNEDHPRYSKDWQDFRRNTGEQVSFTIRRPRDKDGYVKEKFYFTFTTIKNKSTVGYIDKKDAAGQYVPVDTAPGTTFVGAIASGVPNDWWWNFPKTQIKADIKAWKRADKKTTNIVLKENYFGLNDEDKSKLPKLKFDLSLGQKGGFLSEEIKESFTTPDKKRLSDNSKKYHATNFLKNIDKRIIAFHEDVITKVSFVNSEDEPKYRIELSDKLEYDAETNSLIQNISVTKLTKKDYFDEWNKGFERLKSDTNTNGYWSSSFSNSDYADISSTFKTSLNSFLSIVPGVYNDESTKDVREYLASEAQSQVKSYVFKDLFTKLLHPQNEASTKKLTNIFGNQNGVIQNYKSVSEFADLLNGKIKNNFNENSTKFNLLIDNVEHTEEDVLGILENYKEQKKMYSDSLKRKISENPNLDLNLSALESLANSLKQFSNMDFTSNSSKTYTFNGVKIDNPYNLENLINDLKRKTTLIKVENPTDNTNDRKAQLLDNLKNDSRFKEAYNKTVKAYFNKLKDYLGEGNGDSLMPIEYRPLTGLVHSERLEITNPENEDKTITFEIKKQELGVTFENKKLLDQVKHLNKTTLENSDLNSNQGTQEASLKQTAEKVLKTWDKAIDKLYEVLVNLLPYVSSEMKSDAINRLRSTSSDEEKERIYNELKTQSGTGKIRNIDNSLTMPETGHAKKLLVQLEKIKEAKAKNIYALADASKKKALDDLESKILEKFKTEPDFKFSSSKGYSDLKLTRTLNNKELTKLINDSNSAISMLNGARFQISYVNVENTKAQDAVLVENNKSWKAPITNTTEDGTAGFVIRLVNKRVDSQDPRSVNVQYKIVPKVIVDMRNGQPKSKLINALETRTTKLSGFKDPNTELNRLNQIKSNAQITLDYNDKQNILPTELLSGSKMFSSSKILGTFRYENQNYSITRRENKLFVDQLNLEIVDLKTKDITAKNDVSGSITVDFKLSSKTDNSKITDAISKQISGFKTEKERITAEQNGLSIPESVFSEIDKTKLNSEVEISEISNALKSHLSSLNKNIALKDGSLVLEKNNPGQISFKFKLESTKPNLGTSVSTDNHSRNFVINGFYTSEKEIQRLNDLHSNIISITPKNRDVMLAHPSSKKLTLKDVNITISKDSKTYTANSNGEIPELKVKIVELASDNTKNTDDIQGQKAVRFKIESTDSRFSSSRLQSSQVTKDVSGFKTEQDRLDSIVDQSQNWLSGLDLTNIKDNNLTSSESYKQDLITKLNELLNSYDAEVSDLTYKNPNDTAGAVTFDFKLKSKRADLTDIKSTKNVQRQESGFTTQAKELDRLNKLIISEVDFKNGTKNQIPEDVQNVKDQVSTIKIKTASNSQEYVLTYDAAVNAFINNELKIKVDKNDITKGIVESSNNRNGDLPIKIKVSSTKNGFSTKSNDLNFKATEFLREQERLDGVLNNNTPSLAVSNAASRLPKDVKENEVYKLLKTYFDNLPETTKHRSNLNPDNKLDSDPNADFENIRLVPQNSTGTLKVFYKINSALSGLDNIKSSTEKEITISGFQTLNDEKSRLNDLLSNLKVKVNTVNKDVVPSPSLKTIDPNNIEVTVDGEKATYDSNTRQFTFPTKNAKISLDDISVTSWNAKDGTVNFSVKKATNNDASAQSDSANDHIRDEGYKTEQKRLNKAIKDDSKRSISLTDEASKSKKLPSTITESDLTKTISIPDAEFVTPLTLEANDDAGALTIKAKIKSTKNNENLYNNIVPRDAGTIQSSEDYVVVISGFKTSAEAAINPEVITKEIEKVNVSYNKTKGVDSYSSDPQNVENYTFTYESPRKDEFELKDKKVEGYDAIKGKTLVSYVLEPKAEDKKDLKRKVYVVIDGFNTEDKKLEKALSAAEEYIKYNKDDKSNLAPNQTRNAVVIAPEFTSPEGTKVSITSQNPDLNANKIDVTYQATSTKSDSELVKKPQDIPANIDFGSSNHLEPKNAQKSIEGFANPQEAMNAQLGSLDEFDKSEFLSPREKDSFKQKAREIREKVLSGNSYIDDIAKDYADLKNEFKERDKEKTNLFNAISNLAPLFNEKMKEALKDRFMNAKYIEDPSINDESVLEVLKFAVDYNKDLSDLTNQLNKTKSIAGSDDFESILNNNGKLKDIIKKAITESNKVLQGELTPETLNSIFNFGKSSSDKKVPSLKESDEFLSSDQVQDLIRVLKTTAEQAQEVIDLKKEINNKLTDGSLSNLSESEKNKAKTLANDTEDSVALKEIKSVLDSTNSKKDELIQAVNDQYQNMNKDQKDNVKKMIKDSSLDNTILYNPSTQDKSYSNVSDKAHDLDQEMLKLKNNIKASLNTFINENANSDNTKYQNADPVLKDKYKKLINAAIQLGENISEIESIKSLWGDEVEKPAQDTNSATGEANWSVDQVKNLNKLIDQLEDQMSDINELKENAISDIDNLSFLNDKEKEHFKNKIKEAQTPSEVREALDDAKSHDQIKHDAYDQINLDNYPNLNDDQKEALRDKIKNETYSKDKPDLGDSSKDILEEIKDQAKVLDDKMKDLKDEHDKAKKHLDAIKKVFGTDAINSEFEKAIDDAFKTLSNVAIDGNNDANLDSDSVQELIDKLKNEVKKEIAKHLDEIPNLDESKKEQAKEFFDQHNDTQYFVDKWNELLQSDSKSETDNETNVEVTKETPEINSDKPTENGSVYDPSKLKEAYDELVKDSYDSDTQADNLQRLELLVKEAAESVSENDSTETKDLIKDAQDLVKLFNAVNNEDWDLVLGIIKGSTSDDQILSALNDDLDLINKFKTKQKVFGPDDFNKVNNADLSNVIKTLLISKMKLYGIEEKISIWWFITTAINSLLVLISSYFVYKNFKKK